MIEHIAVIPFLLVTPDPPVELGQVAWERNFPKGLTRARKEQKPMMLLFQEVPG